MVSDFISNLLPFLLPVIVLTSVYLIISYISNCSYRQESCTEIETSVPKVDNTLQNPPEMLQEKIIINSKRLKKVSRPPKDT